MFVIIIIIIIIINSSSSGDRQFWEWLFWGDENSDIKWGGYFGVETYTDMSLLQAFKIDNTNNTHNNPYHLKKHAAPFFLRC